MDINQATTVDDLVHQKIKARNAYIESQRAKAINQLIFRLFIALNVFFFAKYLTPESFEAVMWFINYVFFGLILGFGCYEIANLYQIPTIRKTEEDK